MNVEMMIKNKYENINTPNKSDLVFALIIGYAMT
jgi:hypothetical protein